MEINPNILFTPARVVFGQAKALGGFVIEKAGLGAQATAQRLLAEREQKNISQARENIVIAAAIGDDETLVKEQMVVARNVLNGLLRYIEEGGVVDARWTQDYRRARQSLPEGITIDDIGLDGYKVKKLHLFDALYERSIEE